jgi:ATP-dependent protease ClpP protease subunit
MLNNDEKNMMMMENRSVDVKPIGNLITIYLSGEITESENYISAFEAIRYAGENDIVRFNINSPGGDLFTTIQFIRAIAECKAMVVASAEGACMSAATMIFLSADKYEISEHCLFMFHNYSGGTMGKGGEMYDHIINERKWSEKIVHRVYDGFLTDVEIQSILDNKDIWMEGEEVMKRLTQKIDAEIKKEKSDAKKTKAVKKTPAKKAVSKNS